MPAPPPRRADERATDQLRPVTIETGVMKFADGSARIAVGDTVVLVAATLEHRVPPWLDGRGQGWATAEYSMLPRATSRRTVREVKRGRPSGRTAEIQRLIGRSLRAGLDLAAMADWTLILDCDVLQADGGTRTASITGAWVAAVEALSDPFLTGRLERWPLSERVAAISVGILEGQALLDLDAAEDRQAQVDLNVVGTTSGTLIEVQGTAEEHPYSRSELDTMLDLAFTGIAKLHELQAAAVESRLADVEAVQQKGRRRTATPKDEGELWGEPR